MTHVDTVPAGAGIIKQVMLHFDSHQVVCKQGYTSSSGVWSQGVQDRGDGLEGTGEAWRGGGRGLERELGLAVSPGDGERSSRY